MQVSRRLACSPLLIVALALSTASAAPSDPASLVNPLVGTTNGGNVFPGATMPFGMVQFSPEATPVNTKRHDRGARRLRVSRKADSRLQPDQR